MIRGICAVAALAVQTQEPGWENELTLPLLDLSPSSLWPRP